MPQQIIRDLWNFFVVSAPYLILGFFLSGVVHTLLPLGKIKQWLGSYRYRDIFLASAIGVPLPLCSCGVIPAAVALKKAGASNGATSAFLISTPETGIDSIVFTYGLMDFPMSVIRPLAAFITASVAGLFNFWFNEPQKKVTQGPAAVEHDDCCAHPKGNKTEAHIHQHHKPLWYRILHFGFVELVDDLAGWMILGLVLGSLVTSFIPNNFFAELSPTTSRFAVMAVAIPMYICASAATPIAASLVMKGLSPGVALIFLLSGPATNVANMVVMQKHVGKKGVIINVASIMLCSFLLSYLVDYFYQQYGMPHFKIGEHEHEQISAGSQLLAIALILILFSSFYRKYAPKTKTPSCCG